MQLRIEWKISIVVMSFAPAAILLALLSCAPPVTRPPNLTPFGTPPADTPELPSLLATVTFSTSSAATSAPIPTVTALASVPAARPATESATTLSAPTSIATVQPITSPVPNTGGGNQVFVTNLTVQPSPAKAGQPPTFYVTFLNPTGAGQGFNVCVEVWDPNKTKNSIGITTCRSTTIAPGTSQIPATNWKVSGLGGCVGYRAHVVARSGEEERTPFTQPDGSTFWLEFQVCP